ncbi:TPA_asm: P9 [Erysimum trirhavirus 1]|nr:TPA_asm: P9 [Erysimum trirhavirus 1]
MSIEKRSFELDRPLWYKSLMTSIIRHRGEDQLCRLGREQCHRLLLSELPRLIIFSDEDLYIPGYGVNTDWKPVYLTKRLWDHLLPVLNPWHPEFEMIDEIMDCLGNNPDCFHCKACMMHYASYEQIKHIIDFDNHILLDLDLE